MVSSWVVNGVILPGPPALAKSSESREEAFAVDDHPGDLAGADQLALGAVLGGVARGDREAVQAAVDVRRPGRHLHLLADGAGTDVLQVDPGPHARGRVVQGRVD